VSAKFRTFPSRKAQPTAQHVSAVSESDNELFQERRSVTRNCGYTIGGESYYIDARGRPGRLERSEREGARHQFLEQSELQLARPPQLLFG
jgi:hypothetical protein